MPALKPTSYVARIVWLGQVPNRKASLRAVPIVHVDADFDGFPGEDHAGVTRPACVRVKAQHARGTIIRNVRQLSVISAEQLAETAADMGLEAIDPALLGASMVVEGIPDFTHVPPSQGFRPHQGQPWWSIWKIGPARCLLARLSERPRDLVLAISPRHLGVGV